ncbi:MAG: hypothetical protein CBE21_06195 [Proteobacteria bacterium TMED261]|nr:MAG: hypothetical protein CBE21_06195 [Proteobacteria bacterium TMED261]
MEKIINTLFRLAAVTFLTLGCAPPQSDPKNSPPSFLDPAPSPPTSETTIWSGINMMTDPPMNDLIVIVNENRVVDWGKRGTLEVPNDSVGMDMRAYWITKESGEPFSQENSINIDLTNFLVVKGSEIGVRPLIQNAEVIARIENSNLIFLKASESL